MTWFWWLAGAALVAVAALSIWTAFRNPAFVSGLAKIAIGAAWKAVVPAVARRMSPEEESRWRAAQRAGRGDEWLRDWKRRKNKNTGAIDPGV